MAERRMSAKVREELVIIVLLRHLARMHAAAGPDWNVAELQAIARKFEARHTGCADRFAHARVFCRNGDVP